MRRAPGTAYAVTVCPLSETMNFGDLSPALRERTSSGRPRVIAPARPFE